MPEFGSRSRARDCHSCSCCDTCRQIGRPILVRKHPMRLMLVSVLLASTAFAAPPRRRVHIDHLDPAKVGAFEQARKDWVAWIATHHVSDPWGGTMLQVGGS